MTRSMAPLAPTPRPQALSWSGVYVFSGSWSGNNIWSWSSSYERGGY